MQLIANFFLFRGEKATVTGGLWLLFLWFFAAWAVNFWGDFPLNDDWAYARNVQYLSERGEIYFDPWPAQTLIAQTVWGALFTKLFGFSFTVLRVSTLVAGAIGVYYWYKIWLSAGANVSSSVFLTLLLAFNPFYFTLSYSFMTEIPFLAATLGAFYHWGSFFRKDSYLDYAIGIIYALIAILIRQHGVLLPIGFAVAWLCLYKYRRIKLVAKNQPEQTQNPFLQLFIPLFPFLLVFATLFLYNHWREANFGLSAAYGQAESLTLPFKDGSWKRLLFYRVGTIGFYTGLFFAPILYYVFARWWGQTWWRWRFGFILYSMVGIIYYLNSWHHHTIGNIFYNWGLNPELLKDTVAQNDSVRVSHNLWAWVKWLGVINSLLLYWLGAVLLVKIISFLIKKKKQPIGDNFFAGRKHSHTLTDGLNHNYPFFVPQANSTNDISQIAQTAPISNIRRELARIDGAFFRLDSTFNHQYRKLDVYFLQIIGLVCCVLYAGILGLGQYYFDRYHLPLLLFVAWVLTPYLLDLRMQKLRFGAKLLALYALFSALATADFIQFNRARKAATDYLKSQNISPNRIDGGFEFNGWENTYHLRPQCSGGLTSWWFVDKDEFIIGCKPTENYQLFQPQNAPSGQVVNKYPFFRWLSLSYDTVYIHQKPNFAHYDSSYLQLNPNQNRDIPLYKSSLYPAEINRMSIKGQILPPFKGKIAAGDEIRLKCWVCPENTPQSSAKNWVEPKAAFLLWDERKYPVHFESAITDSMGGCLQHELRFIQTDTAKSQLLELVFIPKVGRDDSPNDKLIWGRSELIHAHNSRE